MRIPGGDERQRPLVPAAAARVEEVIWTVDAEQQRAVCRILQEFDTQERRNRREASQHLRAGLDSLQTHLVPMLDESRMERLHEHLMRHRRALRRPFRQPTDPSL